MTFSDRRIVERVKKEFIPVWESVSPVRVAVFKLGDDREVEGTVGGEIALSFCTPEGKVFDILPGLQSPAITYRAIGKAAKNYATFGKDPALIKKHHVQQLAQLKKTKSLTPEVASGRIGAAHAKLVSRLAMGSRATDALSVSAFSKTAIVTPAESITVVEPGGLWLYKALIHDELRRGPLRSPDELRTLLFEQILDQKLGGGREVYDIDDVMPLSIIER